MVRMPVTINVNDTVEDTLTKDEEVMVSTIPAMDGKTEVGVASDWELFATRLNL